MTSSHGGRRPGAGRPRGSRVNRGKGIADAVPAPAVGAPAASVDAGPPGDIAQASSSVAGDPLSICLRAARHFEAIGDFERAAKIAARVAKFFAQPLKPTESPARPHPEQPILPLFDGPSRPPSVSVGKKEAAIEAAQAAAESGGWGDILRTEEPRH